MKLYIVAGEVSGDLHASNLMKALHQKAADIQFRGIGGDKMKAQGLDAFTHISKLNFMGLAEVLKNIFSIRKILSDVNEDILLHKPDALVLVDYPGFNLQLARFAKQHGIRCIYYISPKIWAWRSSRAKIIRDHVDLMLCILPFEKEFYQKYDYEVQYVGNPVPDAIRDYTFDENIREALKKDTRPLIAMLPGSRKQEISQCLPVMLQVSKHFPQYRFVIAALDNTVAQIKELNSAQIEVVCNKTYELLSLSRAAMVTSGTATLETALFRVPQVCCYKTSALTYFVAKQVIRVPYISLVNLIANKHVIKEMIQDAFHVTALCEELKLLTEEGTYRSNMLAEYDQMTRVLGGAGASERAATALLEFVRKNQHLK